MSKSMIYPDFGYVKELDDEIASLYKQQDILNNKIIEVKKALGKSVFLNHQYFDLNEICDKFPENISIDKLVVILKNKRLENIYADSSLEIKHDKENPYVYINDSGFVGSIDLVTGEYITYSYGIRNKHPNVIGIREIVAHE